MGYVSQPLYAFFFILQPYNVTWYHISPCGPDINHEQIYNVLKYGTIVKQYSEW